MCTETIWAKRTSNYKSENMREARANTSHNIKMRGRELDPRPVNNSGPYKSLFISLRYRGAPLRRRLSLCVGELISVYMMEGVSCQ